MSDPIYEQRWPRSLINKGLAPITILPADLKLLEQTMFAELDPMSDEQLQKDIENLCQKMALLSLEEPVQTQKQKTPRRLMDDWCDP